jgi:uroporphyrinogen-III decarboxylase
MTTTVSTMSPKERWLAAINMQPIDRLPFWPKLGPSYCKSQKAPFSNMNLLELYNFIGSDIHLGHISGELPTYLFEARKNTSIRIEETPNTRKTEYITKYGNTEYVEQYDEKSASWHPVTFPIRNLDDISIMTEIYLDTSIIIDKDKLLNALTVTKEHGDKVLTLESIGESPFMYFVEVLAGIENAHLLLMDHQNEVEQLFEAMHRVLKEKISLLGELSPYDVLYLFENTSTTIISPQQYSRYCKQYISEYAQIAKTFNKILILHMCGKLKNLLGDLSTLPVKAFEAFTSPPLGNTTLLDGRNACHDKCLIGGTNAILWLNSAKRIIVEIERTLEPLKHHRGIVITSGGVMPPACDPETIREVCKWLNSYRPKGI